MPEKMTLHYKDGSTVQQDAIDARHTLRNHPTEYQTSPFPADVQKAAQEDAEALRIHLSKLRADGKTEIEVEKARHAWAGVPKEPAVVNKAADLVAPFLAKDKGGGWWAIVDAEGKQVGGNIRRPEGESFNAMPDEDKAEYVKAELASS